MGTKGTFWRVWMWVLMALVWNVWNVQAGVTVGPSSGGASAQNLVPSGAKYTNNATISANAYAVNVTPGVMYYCVITNIANGNSVFDPSLSNPGTIGTSGYTVFNQTPVYCADGNGTLLNQPVEEQIFPSNNASGQFVGSVTAGSTVSPQAVVNGGGPSLIVGGNLYNMAVGQDHVLLSSNTANGSTLELHHYGTTGYADIAFFAAPTSNSFGSDTQFFAMGVGAQNAAVQAVYRTPYLETYNGVSPFYFVAAGTFYGGLYSSAAGDGDWVWYRDGTTNTPMFRINRASATVSNNCTFVINSNIVLHPVSSVPFTAGQLGANGIGLWNSNGVFYSTKSANGSTLNTSTLLSQ